MKIQLKGDLPHQNRALNAVNAVLENVQILTDNNINQNPIINLQDPKIKENINRVQRGEYEDGIVAISSDMQSNSDEIDSLNIDIRMETGTGKTYVYTKMMFELHEKYGFNKFIILVPSTAIKEGTKQFIESDYAKMHFKDKYKNTKISLNVLQAQKRKNSGRKMFPVAISNYVRSTRLEENTISVLLVNDGMLMSNATMEKSDYDQTLLGIYTQPYRALGETKAVLIIDEPHRFKKTNKTYKCVKEKIKPQMIIRYGATFPELSGGQKEYDNLIYNLGSCSAFNEQLIKGVEVEYLPELTQNDVGVKLQEITKNPKSIVLRNEQTKKRYTLEIGESLSKVDDNFKNLFIVEIGKIDDYANAVRLSNGQVIKKDDIFYANIYGKTYQELMISLALKRHFEKERINFFRKEKVKTLALFFIDSIYSYRGDNNDGDLKLTFEKLLSEKLKQEIYEIDKLIEEGYGYKEYRDYLQASLDDIGATNGGYFAQDNSTSDEDIKEEVDRILRDKEGMLSLYNPDGTFNSFRFVFSKWTLREGWDNPNVFTIAKLRSSGSEISKLQEVGRGLRLPVDEKGNRLAEEQFFLSYIIDYSEKNFADKLIDEINSEITALRSIKTYFDEVAKAHEITHKELFMQLYREDLIDNEYNICDGASERVYELFPEFSKGLQSNKVVNRNKGVKSTVKVRKGNFDKLKDLWEALNQKYYMKFDEISEEELITVIVTILEKDIHRIDTISSVVVRTEIVDGKAQLVRENSAIYEVETQIPYNEFLKKIQNITNIPIAVFHKAMIKYNQTHVIGNGWFNTSTMNIFINEFQKWERETTVHRFTYQKLDVIVQETALTDIDGNMKQTILQNDVGIFPGADIVSSKFLYDRLIYDSPLEKINIMNCDVDEVVVFGKIPRRSIRIPVFWGETYSPDFMYVLKKKDGTMQMNLIVETKDVAADDDLRGTEDKKILCAEKFFEQLQSEGINVKFEKQTKKDNIVAMIKKIVS